MDTEKQTTSSDMGTLADDARALLAATADLTGEEIHQARMRLAGTLDGNGNIIERVRAKAIERTKAADRAVRGRPYQAIGIAFGLGVVIGDLLARRCSHNGI